MGKAHVLLLALVALQLLVPSIAWSWPLRGPRRQLKFTWNPPTPPVPTYPCPRTEVPTTPRALWVDPNYNGTVAVGNATHPFKTLAAAWKTLPVAPKILSEGVTISIRPGFLAASNLYSVWGTPDAPLVIQRDPAADPAGAPVVIKGEQLISNTSYLYFKGITFSAKSAAGSYGTNVIRMWASDYTYFLNVTVAGVYNQSYPGTGQAFKAMNCKGVYFEDSDVWGTAPGGWSLTYIAVQYGHICRSKVHHADWCFGLTGGSAYIYVDSNEVYNCGQAALVSGMASGYVAPNQPWMTYGAYGIKVTNNLIHDVWGAGLSVFGGYSILLAHNTLYKVGSRSHIIEIMPATHGCSLTATQCAALNAQGGWYAVAGAPSFKVPSKEVVLLNNLVYNPANESAKWAHFASMAPINQSSISGLPSTLPNPVTMHEGLVVKGNVFVNWHLDPKWAMSIGLDPCYGPSLPCDKPTLLAENLFNVPGLDIAFTDTQSLMLTDATKAALSIAPYKPANQVPFAGWSTPVETPTGQLSNEVPFDRNGVARQQGNVLPGAYYDASYAPAKFCSFGPNPAWAANSTTGWPAECGRVLVGSVCTAACGVNATGADYTARCDESDTWLFLGGGCSTKTCASKPSAYLAPNSAGWDDSCAGSLIGSTCSAACGANATGSGYTARCSDNNTWTVVSGSCQGPPWTPPTPPLPSYPCPRTEAPTHLSPKVLYVDPSYNGSVETGSATQPYKTFTAAWRTLPRNMLTAGVTINIRPGTALSGRLWMDGVWGTPDAPLIIQRDPAYGPMDPPSIIEVVDIFNCTYMYFKGITFKIQYPGNGNVVHFASCSYMYILNCTIAGIYNQGYPGTNQALKVNQVKGLYVEDSNIYGSAPNGVAFDGVSVQYGHVCRSDIHHADWCMYLKGGSAYFIIDSNTVHKCGQAGLRVGQGTGFEFMVNPWLQYEAYGMKMTNNIIYDVWGAGLGVIGGYSVLVAHNSLYRVGSRSHTIEFNYGGRGCGKNSTCTAYVQQGGWGPALSTDPSVSIPSKDVMFLNNVLVNPSNESAQWAHFSVSATLNTTGKGYPWSMPNPISVVQGLVIKGNVLINRHLDPKYPMSLGISPCLGSGLPCDQPMVLAENLINTPNLTLAFTDPESLVLTEESKAALRAAFYKAEADVPFTTWDTPPLGTLRAAGQQCACGQEWSGSRIC